MSFIKGCTIESLVSHVNALLARLQVAVDICAFWTASLLHVRLGLSVGSFMELVGKCFRTVSIEKACSQWAVQDRHSNVLRQSSAHCSSPLCNILLSPAFVFLCCVFCRGGDMV